MMQWNLLGAFIYDHHSKVDNFKEKALQQLDVMLI